MSKKKGDRRERQAEEILEAAGWSVEKPNATPYPQGYGVDFFGMFDIMAFKKGHPPLLIQVKSNRASGITSFHEDCNEVQVPFGFVDVEFWICYDGEGWRVDEISEHGYEQKYDERELEGYNMGEFLKEEYSKEPIEATF